ncbi:MAG: hypothetical protein R6X11_03900, partial [Desulfonatronovibrio sp.]
ISLINCKAYIRYRDIWDLRWLRQHGARPEQDLINAKITDYKVMAFLEKLEDTLSHLPDIIHGKEFREQMSRFLPQEVQERTLRKEKFSTFLVSEITKLLNDVKGYF